MKVRSSTRWFRRRGSTTKKPLHRWLGYANLGIEFAVSFGVFVALGWWVGNRYDMNPWATLVGAGLGFIGAMYNLIREGLRMQREVEAERLEDEKLGQQK